MKHNSLREDRKAKIESIGFIGSTNRSKWLLQYDQLREFRQNNPGAWPVYDKRNPNTPESKLGVFCQTIRRRFKHNLLEEYWLDRFLEIGFNLEGRKDNWFKYYQKIKGE